VFMVLKIDNMRQIVAAKENDALRTQEVLIAHLPPLDVSEPSIRAHGQRPGEMALCRASDCTSMYAWGGKSFVPF
jgi:hypothetical protein